MLGEFAPHLVFHLFGHTRVSIAGDHADIDCLAVGLLLALVLREQVFYLGVDFVVGQWLYLRVEVVYVCVRHVVDQRTSPLVSRILLLRLVLIFNLLLQQSQLLALLPKHGN